MKKKNKIYFAGSIRGSEADRETYLKLIEELKNDFIVLTEHVGNKKLLANERKLSDAEIEARDMNWIKESDFLVAEVTAPSHGVGIELNEAKHLKKPVICLSKGERVSAMISGNSYYKVVFYKEINEAIKAIKSLATSL